MRVCPAGLSKDFHAGIVYCSHITATLLQRDMGLRPERICPLPMDRELDVNGVKVTLVDANHCPGAVMFLFQVNLGQGEPACKVLLTSESIQVERDFAMQFMDSQSGMVKTPAASGLTAHALCQHEVARDMSTVEVKSIQYHWFASWHVHI